jgi:hypothetical protein
MNTLISEVVWFDIPVVDVVCAFSTLSCCLAPKTTYEKSFVTI